jgi:predicted RNA-binding protein Jag
LSSRPPIGSTASPGSAKKRKTLAKDFLTTLLYPVNMYVGIKPKCTAKLVTSGLVTASITLLVGYVGLGAGNI